MENLFFDKSDLKYCGKNVIIGKTVRIRKPHLVSIGDNVIIDDFTYIPCGMEIGSYTHIGASNSFIGGPGFVKVGSFVNIAPSCQIVTGSNDYRGGGLVGPAIPARYCGESIIENIEIGDFALLACQTIVLPGVIIPEGMSTGAFSLVKKLEYKPWTLYVGVPCKEIGTREGKLMKLQAQLLLKEENSSGVY
jgi:acetyltransferase-like isoleucine patch superfamily enzyme